MKYKTVQSQKSTNLRCETTREEKLQIKETEKQEEKSTIEPAILLNTKIRKIYACLKTNIMNAAKIVYLLRNYYYCYVLNITTEQLIIL